MNLHEHFMLIAAEEAMEVSEQALQIAAAATTLSHRIFKALRFSPAEIQPGQPYSNAQRIAIEYAQLRSMMDCLHARGLVDLNTPEALAAYAEKPHKVDRFLALSKKAGTLQNQQDKP